MHPDPAILPRLDLQDETGASAVEYGLLASLIAAVIAGVVATLGEEVVALFESLQWP